MTGRHLAALIGSGLLVFGVVTAGVIVALRVNPLHQTTLTGVVLVDSSDARKQMPIAGAEVVARMGNSEAKTRSDESGSFRVTIPSVLRLGRNIQLMVGSPDYQPAVITASTSDQLFIARLRPIGRSEEAVRSTPQHTVANPRIRYTVPTQSFVEVGAEVQTLVVANKANQACRAAPCSPDGKWQATSGGMTLDAHEHNQFRNVRASCIAGSCPFTRIDTENVRDGGQVVHISVLNWGDTATFLVEADVVRLQVSDMVRQSFPVKFGEGFSFTLPPQAAGPSIEAELDKQDIFFPLGPELLLSWATCSSTVNRDRSTLYSCELKPDYRFL